jgi:chloramphenicol-sensitive protein RarD
MQRKGVMYAIGAYMTWGLFPIYWKRLEGVPAGQLIAHRIVWSFILLCLVIITTRQARAVRAALNPRILTTYLVAALLISVNWYTYVWAVTHHRVVEASLGYYINPLFSVLLGVLIFREKLRPFQWIPLIVAALGVLFLTLTYGTPPWVALVLAATFGLYGMLKKTAPLSSLWGLSLETGLLFLPALAYLIFAEAIGRGAFLHATVEADWLMVGGGVVTAVPLLLFASAASRVPLSTMGILQYLNPSMQFLLGVLAYHEAFSRSRLIGFGIVWAGLALFWAESLYTRRASAGLPVPELGEG